MAHAATQTAQMDVYDYFSFIGPPIVPLTPDPVTVFSAAGVDVSGDGNSTISRYEATEGNVYDYVSFAPWNMLLGEGYKIDYRSGTLPHAQPVHVSYVGLPDGVPTGTVMTDMWVSLPGNQFDGQDIGGQHWISTPFNHAIPFNKDGSQAWDPSDPDMSNIMVTDGNTVRTFRNASEVAPIWIADAWTYYDGASRNQYDAGCYGYHADNSLRPGSAYKVFTYKDNLALIIPAVPLP